MGLQETTGYDAFQLDKANHLPLWAALTGLQVNVDFHSTPHTKNLKAGNVFLNIVKATELVDLQENADAVTAGIEAATWRFKSTQLVLLSYYRDQIDDQAQKVFVDHISIPIDVEGKTPAAPVSRIDLIRNINPLRDVFVEDDANATLMPEVAKLIGRTIVLHVVQAGIQRLSTRFSPDESLEQRRNNYPYLAARAPFDDLHAYYNNVNGVAV